MLTPVLACGNHFRSAMSPSRGAKAETSESQKRSFWETRLPSVPVVYENSCEFVAQFVLASAEFCPKPSLNVLDCEALKATAEMKSWSTEIIKKRTLINFRENLTNSFSPADRQKQTLLSLRKWIVDENYRNHWNTRLQPMSSNIRKPREKSKFRGSGRRR